MQPPESLWENQHIHRSGHVFQNRLGIHFPALRFERAYPGQDSAGVNLIFPNGMFQSGDGFGIEGVKIFQLGFIFLERMAGDKKSQDFFFRCQPLMLIPVGYLRKRAIHRMLDFILKHPK